MTMVSDLGGLVAADIGVHGANAILKKGLRGKKGMLTKGWRGESMRHSMSAHGIKTSRTKEPHNFWCKKCGGVVYGLPSDHNKKR